MASARYRERGSRGSGRVGGGGGFTPFQMPLPPSGFYDPSLDASQAAANRGLGDLTADTNTANTRDTVDYGLGRDNILRGQTRGLEDLGSQRQGLQTTFDRGTADLGTARSRGEQDYQRNVGLLQRRYQQLGGVQRQQQSRAGVMRGGAMLQAAAKRQGNETLDQQPLDTGQQRFLADNSQAAGRLGQDFATQGGLLDRAQGRLGEDTTLQLGNLALKMAPPDATNPLGGRSFQDRTTALVRAQRENTNFGLDSNAQRYYQAAGQGWEPPQGPSNEFVGAQGQHYQVRTQGRQSVGYDPSGQVLWRRARRG